MTAATFRKILVLFLTLSGVSAWVQMDVDGSLHINPAHASGALVVNGSELVVNGINVLSTIATLSPKLSKAALVLKMFNVDAHEYQPINSLLPSTGIRYDFAFVTVGSEHFLAVAAENSRILRWNGTTKQFEFFLNTGPSVTSWETFVINGNTFLAQPNNAVTGNNIIYRYDTTLKTFVVSQTIPASSTNSTASISGWCFVDISSTVKYLISIRTGSRVYQWNSANDQFYENTSVTVPGSSRDINTFRYGSDVFLVVTSASNKVSLFKYQAGNFVFLSDVILGTTPEPHDTELFVDAFNTRYMAVSLQAAPSVLYRWNGTDFVFHQAFPTVGGNDVAVFTVDGVIYMTFASFSLPSQDVYRWNEKISQFDQISSFDFPNMAGCDAGIVEGRPFLAITGTGSSKLFAF